MGIELVNLVNNEGFQQEAFEEVIESSPLTKFVLMMNKIVRLMGTDPATDKNRMFFRGQADSDWGIEPSVFRKGYLGVEHEIIRSAISRSPADFSTDSPFSQLAKLQHYGLPTRLLDVTHSPLVALYFACQTEQKPRRNEDGEETIQECDGAVFVASDNPELPESLKVQALSHIAKSDLNQMDSQTVLDELQKIGAKIGSFIDIKETLIHDYFVLADMNNERIIRQSGAFLICGCVNCMRANDSEWEFEKAQNDMQSSFSYKIIIDADDKQTILDELDFFNINEATLFPELEHQLSYISTSNRKGRKGANQFLGYVDLDIDSIAEMARERSQDDLETKAEAVLGATLKGAIETYINEPSVVDKVSDLFVQNATVDWYRRNSIRANILLETARGISDLTGTAPDDSKRMAKGILDTLMQEIYS